MPATVALGRTMLLIRRVLLVWWVALAVGWAAGAVAGPAEDVVLFSEASGGDAAGVLALLDKGADVNARGDNGATALIAASQNGHLAVAQVLLAKGAEINAKNNDGLTALIVASVNDHLDIVQALLAKGPDINAKEKKDGMTALMMAAFDGHLEIVEALLAKGADVNAKATDGNTALILAAVGNDGIVQFLPSSPSSENDRREIVQALLAKGADVNAKASDGTTALGAAAQGGHADIRALLVEAQALNKPIMAPARGNVGVIVARLPDQFIGKWRQPDSFHCDYRVRNIELTEATMTVTLQEVGFGVPGKVSSYMAAVTYSRDGEFYAATPTAGNGPAAFYPSDESHNVEPIYVAIPTARSGPALKFKFNSPNIVLGSGCVLVPAR